jgi:histidine triad (HIT) family protein
MDSHEAEQVKRQLLNNIESNFPKDKADILKRQIMSMSDEQLESFLEKSSSNQTSECIFCSIASGKMHSYKVDENDSAIAILEINPVSKGHVLVLSKKHLSLEEFPEDISLFAKSVAEKIKERLKPKDVELASVDFGGHGIMNLIPVYKDESINSKKYRASKEELEEVSKILIEKKEEKKEKIKKERLPRLKTIRDKKSWLPKKIP